MKFNKKNNIALVETKLYDKENLDDPHQQFLASMDSFDKKMTRKLNILTILVIIYAIMQHPIVIKLVDKWMK